MTTEKTATFFTKLKKILWIVFLFFFFSVYAGYILWCTGAICYAPMPLIFRIPAVIIFLPLVISAPFIKPRIIFLSGGIALLLMCSILWSLITPTNRKLWVAEYARLPKIEWLDEDSFRIRDIRDFHFFTTTDYMVRYTDEIFDLDKLKALDYITVYWPQLMEKEIAHVMLRFRFAGNKNVLVSCETRRTAEGEFGGINNLFKQSGLIYVFATERDILALRTNIRKPEEQVFIYEMDLSSEQRKKIFRHLAERVNSLHTKPEFYNTITANCLTALLPSLHAGIEMPWFDISYLASGLSDRAVFDAGFLKKEDDETFEELKKRSWLNPATKQWDHNPETYPALVRKWEKENDK